MDHYDIAVVGAGAAGLTAAIFAKRAAPEARIVMLDGAPKIGAKILISGGGRCNVTHDVVTAADFNGNRNVVARVLRTFTVEQTIDWFRDMGVELKREETGKLFPTTDRARTVLDALLRSCEGVDVRTKHRVESIERRELFELGEVTARRVILSTGGRSVPKTGSDGLGYELIRALGHTVTETFPALVPLIVEEGHWFRSLSGTSVDAELSVRGGSRRVIERQRGAMLFTHFGISGPVVMDISRHWIAARRGDPAATLTVSFLPGESAESIDALLVAAARRNPRSTVQSILRGRVPERLLDVLSEGTDALASLPREERRRVARAFSETSIPVLRDRGFDYAEVTAGGVPLNEIDVSTMASRRCPGLFLCGEILDVDGRIGGYNFQWAWASGRLAGQYAARSLHNLGS